MTNEKDMQVTISGNKLPLTILIVGITALISTIIYSTIWLTKLDDRVYDNAEHIVQLQKSQTKQIQLIHTVQGNCAKQTIILGELIKRIERDDK